MVTSPYTHGQLILLRQFIHTKDSNYVLERLVVLEDLLDSCRDLIVLLANLHIRSREILEHSFRRRPYDAGV
jgi:hypothetical protein